MPKSVLILGSSVAFGTGAPPSRGWAHHLERELLAASAQTQVVNAAVGGFDTSRTLQHLGTVDKGLLPAVVVVALSLANEGLPRASTAPAVAAVKMQFTEGLQSLAAAISDKWPSSRVVFGGVYPFGMAEDPEGGYDGEQYAALLEVHEEMLAWRQPVIPFLGKVDNGCGHWLPGISVDDGHPNAKGHALMFKAVDIAEFEV